MNPITKALHCRIDDTDAFSVVTPLYQCSAFQGHSPYFYTRKNNPNVAELESVILNLEDAQYAIAVTTGMSAITLALNFLSPGDILVINKDIYGCSYKLFHRFAKHMRVELKILDLSIKSNISEIPDNSRMVFFETPTNPFLKTVDIASVVRKVKASRPDTLVVVDNTWATPIFQRPLEEGADISLHSATKYFSGHSDVMGGVLLTNRSDISEELRQERFYTGAILDPHSAWLLRRSMQTFALRMREHQRTASQLKTFLESCPQVTHVYYPEIDGHQLKGYGGLIFFDLREDLVERYPVFTKNLKLFSTGTGMACVTSMVAQPYTGSHASMTPEEKEKIGLGKKLIRLSFGLEDPLDLQADLANALKGIDEQH